MNDPYIIPANEIRQIFVKAQQHKIEEEIIRRQKYFQDKIDNINSSLQDAAHEGIDIIGEDIEEWAADDILSLLKKAGYYTEIFDTMYYKKRCFIYINPPQTNAERNEEEK